MGPITYVFLIFILLQSELPQTLLADLFTSPKSTLSVDVTVRTKITIICQFLLPKLTMVHFIILTLDSETLFYFVTS